MTTARSENSRATRNRVALHRAGSAAGIAKQLLPMRLMAYKLYLKTENKKDARAINSAYSHIWTAHKKLTDVAERQNARISDPAHKTP